MLLPITQIDPQKQKKMSAVVATNGEASKEQPMHIDVQDLTFGYAGREVHSRDTYNNRYEVLQSLSLTLSYIHE